jgi:DNA-binding transcriptional regulator GbsR (MarR family)
MEKSQPHIDAVEQFVMLWGEMASAWGINKTMAQIHALLYAESEPMDTDTIMHRLGISRGNANMNLRSLVQWDLVYKADTPGQRKDYYTAEKEVWTIVSTIVSERQQREIAPIRNNLEQCLNHFNESSTESPAELEFKQRIENFIEFLDMFERFTEALLPYINKKNLAFIKKMVKLAEAGQMLSGKSKKTNEKSSVQNNE